MKIFNTLTHKKEEFVPVNPGEVGIYVCGPTVYNYFHIGNARAFVVFDTFRRFLIYKGEKVKYVQNFTDVDDKMIKKANEEDTTIKAIAKRYIAAYLEDARALNIMDADVFPRATEHIGEIIKMIKTLESKGLAYNVNGNVYFDTQSYPDYRPLTGQNLDDLNAGARIDVDDEKKSYADFALWKAQKPGEPAWGSPWGKGRPGWHIECSAMSQKYLGETFDIHAGGIDLMFPHHTNEIAQSEGTTGKKYVNYWMHNGHINIDNKKMSKSKGTAFMVRDILKDHSPEVVRYYLISSHYRGPVNYTEELLMQAKNGYDRLVTVKQNLIHLLKGAKTGALDEELKNAILKQKERFINALDDDLNTADALSVLFDLARIINKELTVTSSIENIEFAQKIYIDMANVLGILIQDNQDISEEVETLIEQREAARKNKDYNKADEIRNELTKMGIVLEDTPTGVRWRKE